jgi:hypothetical protein
MYRMWYVIHRMTEENMFVGLSASYRGCNLVDLEHGNQSHTTQTHVPLHTEEIARIICLFGGGLFTAIIERL